MSVAKRAKLHAGIFFNFYNAMNFIELPFLMQWPGQLVHLPNYNWRYACASETASTINSLGILEVSAFTRYAFEAFFLNHSGQLVFRCHPCSSVRLWCLCKDDLE